MIEDDDNADYRNSIARITRTKTLDGGAHITHSGAPDGDRTLLVNGRITEASAAALWTLHRANTYLHVSTNEGFYVAAIQELKIDNGRIQMTIYIKTKEA